jgi:hypothetical protein
MHQYGTSHASASKVLHLNPLAGKVVHLNPLAGEVAHPAILQIGARGTEVVSLATTDIEFPSAKRRSSLTVSKLFMMQVVMLERVKIQDETRANVCSIWLRCAREWRDQLREKFFAAQIAQLAHYAVNTAKYDALVCIGTVRKLTLHVA